MGVINLGSEEGSIEDPRDDVSFKTDVRRVSNNHSALRDEKSLMY